MLSRLILLTAGLGFVLTLALVLLLSARYLQGFPF